VSFGYPGATGLALSGVRLAAFAGEIVAVVGGNGSGKSTLARLANGLLQPAEGRVVVAGTSAELCTSNPRDIWPVRAAVGLLFQDPDDQIVGATVEDDVAFGLENLGIPREEMRERVAAILGVVGLSAEAATEAHLLSGGQKQRLALAGVLVLHPSVLVLDEPTSMLDPPGREDVLAFVERLASEGAAVLLITQHMEEAVRADRLLALDGGRLVYDGTPRDFFISGPFSDLPLGVPHALDLARDLEAVFGPGCAGLWTTSGPPLTEEDLVTALARDRSQDGSAS
jgi:energy-coupling factor transport system ATP-binding protein